MRKRLLLILSPVALVALGLLADWSYGLPEGRVAAYVGAQTCRQCHQRQFFEWRGSNHDRAMEHATEETVLGNFNNQTLEHRNQTTGKSYGVVSRMFRRDGKFYIDTENQDGAAREFEIKFTFGVRPLQQYLVEMEGGRLQALSVAWNTEKKEWLLLDMEGQRISPLEPLDAPLHWTGRAMNWNHMCADCHSTNLQKGYDLEANSYHTTYSEIDVSCEACHGPGSIHLELASARSLFWDRHYGYGLAKLKGQSSKTEIETCAKCHSRRQVIDPDQRPGHEYLDHYVPELLDTHAYHADGQILFGEETYEYGSFLQSKMYRKGVRCSDCHNPHTAQLRAQGNDLCIRCHTPAKYDSPVHHFHKPESRGALCVECHMPETTYMLVDPRRDHSIRIPRPDLTVKLKQQNHIDLPNACNRCHTKPAEDAAWAAAKIDTWYGPKRRDDPHYGEIFAAGRQARPEAERGLIQISNVKKQEEHGPIVRATAILLLSRYPSAAGREAIETALLDPEPLVRYAAVRSAQDLEPEKRVKLVEPLLADPVRAVRIESALVLSTAPANVRPNETEGAYAAALAEYRQGAKVNDDQAGAHFELGMLAANFGDDARSEREYRTTLRIDPLFQRARGSLAALYRDRDDRGAGENVLREGVSKFPALAAAHYELGLYLAEDEARLADALEALSQAAALEPENELFQYNYGMALGKAGRLDEAEQALSNACRRAPDAESYWLALALVMVEREKWEPALAVGRRLLQFSPQDVNYHLLVGLALAHSGQRSEAEPHLRPVPDDFLAALAATYQEQGRWRLAYFVSELLIARSAEHPHYQYLHGLSLWKLGRTSEARAALALVPDELLLQLALTHERQSRLSLARHAVEELLRRDGTNAGYRGLWERLKPER